MKILIATLAIASIAYAQDTPIVTAVISGQGADVIKRTTGYSPANSALARVDICNADTLNDHNQSGPALWPLLPYRSSIRYTDPM